MESWEQKSWFAKNLKYIPGLLGLVILLGALLMFINKSNPEAFKVEQTPVSIASVDEIHSTCEAKSAPSEKFDCYEVNFTSYMKANGGRKTLLLLDELQKKGGYAQANCHPLSHKVGNIALHVYGSVPAAVPEYLPVCHSGYYHGLLEEYLGTAESYEKGVAEVCGTTQAQSFFNWFQCNHGLGHGIMQFRNNEVPQSLVDCDLLDPANNGPEICYAGVFMENITTDEKTGHPAKYIRKEDPIYPCNAVDDKYRSACYFLASSQILKINGWNFPETFKACETAEQKYQYLCFQSLGRDVSGSTLRNNDRVKELCGLAGENKFAKTECYFGAVRDYINEKGEFDSAIKLCNFIETEFQSRCYDGVLYDMSQYRQGQAFEQVCSQMPEKYEAECMLRPH
ncbi:MAG: hypothetical protein KW793_01755 [Candidatus Doudnabacteria bacterium]|nr:hypothetical protein [Candidatus Doudnabacteria bacterium]